MKKLKLISKTLEKDFKKTRQQVKKAIDSCPDSIKFEDAEKQVEKSNQNFPTLEGRLSHPLKTRKEAILQMQKNGDVLTDLAKEYLKSHQNYYECIGCGNCTDVDYPRGKCEICGCQKWIPKTT